MDGATEYSRHSDWWGTRYRQRHGAGTGAPRRPRRGGRFIHPRQGTAGYPLSAEQDVSTTVGELTALGVRAMGVPVDVTQWGQVQAMVETVTQRLGPIDILCNNAGVIDTGLVVETTEAQWDTMMQVNVKGVFLCCKAIAPGMMTRRQGRIINTASIAGKRGNAACCGLLCLQVCRDWLYASVCPRDGALQCHGQCRVPGHFGDSHVA